MQMALHPVRLIKESLLPWALFHILPHHILWFISRLILSIANFTSGDLALSTIQICAIYLSEVRPNGACEPLLFQIYSSSSSPAPFRLAKIDLAPLSSINLSNSLLGYLRLAAGRGSSGAFCDLVGSNFFFAIRDGLLATRVVNFELRGRPFTAYLPCM